MSVNLDRGRSVKKWLFSPMFLLLLFIVVLFSLRGVYKVYQKETMSREYLERAQNELKKVHDREESLANSVQYLKTSQGIDAELRTKFRVVKEGEEVAVIVGAPTEATTTSTQVAAPVGIWQKIKNWF